MIITLPLKTGHPVIDSFAFEALFEGPLLVRTSFVPASLVSVTADAHLSGAVADWLLRGFADWHAGAADPWRAGFMEFCSFADLRSVRAVQEQLLQTSRGELLSYGDLAERALGSAKAARAAGTACARNPLPLLVPCHRVVPAHVLTALRKGDQARDYGNYAYGPELKAALIEYERK